jgi:hypothetical protein
MFSEDDEHRPLLTEDELYDACLHDAATIVVAFVFGCEFEDCRLNDDGYRWPTSVSRIELKYPPDCSLDSVASIHEAGAMAVAKGMAAGLTASTRAGRPSCSTSPWSGKRSRPWPNSLKTTTRATAVTVR